MSKSKKNKTSLGKSLIKKKNKVPKNKEARFEHIDIVKEDHNKLQSIIEQNALSEFLQEAELSSKKFEAAKDIKISTKTEGQMVIIDLNSLKSQLNEKLSPDELLKNMRIPRRPKWDGSTSAELLVQLENQSFLNWRRDLAKVEEKYYDLHLTPYEKNPEVWRQLWRVIEKSDIVVQIVDGRDPLFFRCTDLEQYVKEVDSSKENILLINKADLLSESIRKHWNEYLLKHKINHIFFSARFEQEKINKDDKPPIETKIEEKNDKNFDQQDENNKESSPLKIPPQTEENSYNNTPKIATRDILLKTLKNLVAQIKSNKEKSKDLATIGMVGYPNVGKSSIINVLCRKKLVGVAARPGKTKHFQTIFIEKDVLLCDCPGLVFPSCSSTKAEMACNGVLPIDNLKDYMSPIEVLAGKIPKRVFEKLYHIKIDGGDHPSATNILASFAINRGFYTGGSGLPDLAKVSRIVLKDLVNGRLLLCKLSPEYDEKKDGIINVSNLITEETHNEHKSNQNEGDFDEEKKNIDNEFFVEKKVEFDEKDVEMLIQGKNVKGLKLTKQMRRDIKHALKRGENVNLNQILSESKKEKPIGTMGKNPDNNYYRFFGKTEENQKNNEQDDDYEDVEEEDEDME